MENVHVTVVGRSEIRLGDTTIDPRADIVFRGLLLLTLNCGRPMSRSEFAEMLWPGSVHPKREARLRWLLAKLRRLGVPVPGGTPSLHLDRDRVTLDISNLRSFAPAAIGPILHEIESAQSPRYQDWLDERRRVLTDEALAAVIPRLRAASARGDDAAVLDLGHAVLRLDACNEEGAIAVAQAKSRLGSLNQAIAGLEEFVRRTEEVTDAGVAAKALLGRCRRAAEAGRERMEPRIIGRESELGAIGTLLSKAAAGFGDALLIAGSAGIGKSRLIDESALRAMTLGMQVVRVCCQPSDIDRPFSGYHELIDHLVGLRGAAGCDPHALSFLRSLTTSAADTGISADGTREQSEAASDGRAAILAATIELLDAVSSETPLLISVDDVHCASPSTSTLWRAIASETAKFPIAWLFSARPTGNEGTVRGFRKIRLRALDAAQSRALVEQVLAILNVQPDDATCRSIVDRAGGSPLALRELARQSAAGSTSDGAPAALMSIFDTALDSIEPTAIHVLQAAATLGTFATIGRIERVVRLDRPALLTAIIELEEIGAFSTSSSVGLCAHLLWAESALARCPTLTQRLFHQFSAECLEKELLETADTALLWECARHWQLAGFTERTLRALTRGAETLARARFPLDAAHAYERAIALCTSEAESLVLMECRARLLVNGGDFASARQQIQQWTNASARLNPNFDRHNALELVAGQLSHAESGDLTVFMERSLECAKTSEATAAHRFAAAKECAQLALALGRPDLIAEAWAAVEHLSPNSYPERADRLRTEWYFERNCGNARHGLAVSRARVRLARREGDLERALWALGNIGEDLVLLGRVGDARSAYLETLARAREARHPRLQMYAHDRLIWFSFEFEDAHANRERLDQAEGHFETLARMGHGNLTRDILRIYKSELAIAEARGQDAIDILGPLPETVAVPNPSMRAALLSVRLAALALLDHQDSDDGIPELLLPAFAHQSCALDRPAKYFATYLKVHGSVARARRFAHYYIRSVRRQQYPAPEILLALASAHDPVNEDDVTLPGGLGQRQRTPSSPHLLSAHSVTH